MVVAVNFRLQLYLIGDQAPAAFCSLSHSPFCSPVHFLSAQSLTVAPIRDPSWIREVLFARFLFGYNQVWHHGPSQRLNP
jgi:hypothetical protein